MHVSDDPTELGDYLEAIMPQATSQFLKYVRAHGDPDVVIFVEKGVRVGVGPRSKILTVDSIPEEVRAILREQIAAPPSNDFGEMTGVPAHLAWLVIYDREGDTIHVVKTGFTKTMESA